MKVSVEELRQWLDQFPDDATVSAYEGEITGIVVRKGEEELGHIETDA